MSTKNEELVQVHSDENPKQMQVDVEDVKEECEAIITSPNVVDVKKEEFEPIIPPEPHTDAPIASRESLIDTSNINGLQSFFSTPDYAPPVPFNWAIYGDLRLTAPNVVELVRNSCEKMCQNSKYIDINYSYLAEYAKTKLGEKRERKKVSEINDEAEIKSDWISEMKNISERETINLLCLFMILRFGSGFDLQCAAENIGIGIQNMHEKYGSLNTATLDSIEWNIELISQLFEINYGSGPNGYSKSLASLCHMIRKCIEEVIHILSLKKFMDFAEYVYYHIDLAWIKSQTKELSALEDVKWKLNEDTKLGLELAPTKSSEIRRCVVVGFKATDDNPLNQQNNTNIKRLVNKRAFIYAINDQIVYNLEFEEIIHKIKEICKEFFINNINNGVVTIQFGLHLDREPNTVQALLFNFINDFPCLNDQYLYKNVFGKNQNLRIYLFQKVQLIVKELYYNLYTKKGIKIFNFKDINSLVPLYNNIPFVFLTDNVLKIKKEFKTDFEKYINDKYILKASDLEVEMRASALWALELILKQTVNWNIRGLTNYLFNKGECHEYSKYVRHCVRDTIYY